MLMLNKLYHVNKLKQFCLPFQLAHRLDFYSSETLNNNVKNYSSDVLLDFTSFEKILNNSNKNGIEPSKAVDLLELSGTQMIKSPEFRIDLAKRVFEKTKVKDVHVYNALLESFVYNEYSESISSIMEDMKNDKITPNSVTYANMIGCCCVNGDLKSARKLLQFVKSKNLPVSDSIFAYMCYGMCLNGLSKNTINSFNAIRSKDEIISHKVIYFLCKGLAKTKEFKKLNKVIKKEASYENKMLKTKDFIDIALILLKLNNHSTVLNLTKLLNAKELDFTMLLHTFKEIKNANSILMNIAKNFNVILENPVEQQIFVSKTISSNKIRKMTFEELLQLVNEQSIVVSDSQLIFENIFELAYNNNFDLCFDIILEMKKRNLSIQSKIILDIIEQSEKLKKFCLQNNIIQGDSSETLEEIISILSDHEKPSKKLTKKMVNKALMMKNIIPSNLAKALMQMKSTDNFNSILCDALIDYINKTELNDYVIESRIKPLMYNLCKLNFQGFDEYTVLLKLDPSKHFLLKLLTVKDYNEVQRIKLQFTPFHKALVSLYSTYSDFNKFIKQVDICTKKSKYNSRLFLNLVNDSYKLTNDEQRNELFKIALSQDICSHAANTILWHYIANGNVEKVKEIHQKQLFDKRNFLCYFIPSKYLDESMRLALTVHLTEIYGEEICNWIIYLSCLSNGKVNEAADFLKQNQMKWPDMNLIQIFSHSSGYLEYLPQVLDHFIEQCKDIKGFSPFFYNADFIDSLIKIGKFKQLQIIIESAAKNHHTFDIITQRNIIKCFPNIQSFILRIVLQDTQLCSLFDDNLKVSLVSLKKLVITNSEIPTYILEAHLLHLSCDQALLTEAIDFLREKFDEQNSFKLMNVKLQNFLKNSKFKEASDYLKISTFSESNTLVQQSCSEIAHLSREKKDLNILACLLSSSRLYNPFLKREIAAFVHLKNKFYRANNFPISKIIVSEIADDEKAVTKAYEQAWKYYEESNDLKSVKNLTAALLLFTDNKILFKNIEKLEVINYNLLPHFYETCVDNVTSLDHLKLLLKAVKPLLSVRSQAYFIKNVLNKYKELITGTSYNNQLDTFNEIEKTFRQLPSYLQLKNTTILFSQLKHHSSFGIILPRNYFRSNKLKLDDLGLKGSIMESFLSINSIE